jgi:membrane-bound lytic murein transglycosylase D
MKRSGRSDYWTLTASGSYLPRETRDYVPLVMASMIIARNPAQYGMDVRPIDVPGFETVTLPSAVDLRWIAEWVGTTVRAIQDLNPELRRWLTPVRASYYQLKVPGGTGDIVRAHLARTDPSELAPLDWHTVEKGETLIGVARKLKVNRIDLAEANYLSTGAQLQIGQRLIVPRAPTLLRASQGDGSSPESQPAPESRPVETLAEASDAAPEQPGPASLVHRVKRGDTLFSLAKQYRTTVASLKIWNRLRSNTILVGQRLTIFTEPVTVATN